MSADARRPRSPAASQLLPFDDDGEAVVPIDELREELRRLWRVAPGGTWTAPAEQALTGGIVSVMPDGRRVYLGACFYGEAVAQLVVAARRAVPVLFGEIDRLRARGRGLPVLGDVKDGGRVTWRGAPPAAEPVPS